MSKEETKQFGFAVARIFFFAALPAFFVATSGAGPVNDVATAKAVVVAAAAGAIVAGVRAVYGAVRAGQVPFPKFGV